MTFIDIHTLQYVPISCINRDDAGLPKTVAISGVRRARWSSQSQKHVLRNRLRDALEEGAVSTRTRRLPQMVADTLAERGWEAQQAHDLVVRLFDVKPYKKAGSKDLTEEERADGELLTQIILPVPATTPAAIADALGEPGGEDPLEGKKDKDLRKIIDAALSPLPLDTMLLGRFIADGDRTDGAVSVAHAVGTSADGFVSEFWTAVDDLAGDQGHAGSALMGSQGLTSGVLYRYATVDLDELAKNYAKADVPLSEAKDPVQVFISEFARLRPEAMKRSSAPYTEPALVRLDVTDKPRSLVDAFTRPIEAADVSEASAQRLVEHAEKLDETYGEATSTYQVATVPGAFPTHTSLDEAIDQAVADAFGDDA